MREPLAPPRMSEPRKVEADAHATETNSETESPKSNIFAFRAATSDTFEAHDPLLGSEICQINSSLGTSLPT